MVGHFHALATLSTVNFEWEIEPAPSSAQLWHEENNLFLSAPNKFQS